MTSFIEKLTQIHPGMTFQMLDLGARPLSETKDSFYQLLASFPGSKLAAMELDFAECEQWNKRAYAGLTYYSYTIGKTEEQRMLYHTEHPMCSSLYKPNEEYLERFVGLEVMKLKRQEQINTISIDTFCQRHFYDDLDFIKADIQGGELDAFQGASTVLKRVGLIVTEVEFVHLYENQPLFSDVQQYLAQEGFIFHKFLSTASLPLKNGDTTDPSGQLLWGDAVFMKKPELWRTLLPEKLVKLAVLLDLFGSPGMAKSVIQEMG